MRLGDSAKRNKKPRSWPSHERGWMSREETIALDSASLYWALRPAREPRAEPISRGATAGLWIGAAWRASHAGAPRIGLAASVLAGGCWRPLSLLLHRRLALGCRDAGRCDQDGRG